MFAIEINPSLLTKIVIRVSFGFILCKIIFRSFNWLNFCIHRIKAQPIGGNCFHSDQCVSIGGLNTECSYKGKCRCSANAFPINIPHYGKYCIKPSNWHLIQIRLCKEWSVRKHLVGWHFSFVPGSNFNYRNKCLPLY